MRVLAVSAHPDDLAIVSTIALVVEA
jgi:LmbE family N-acetylglucosaminyl deacetylase